jgi:glycine/D-amino acid oxidase-like deaminating enzyme
MAASTSTLTPQRGHSFPPSSIPVRRSATWGTDVLVVGAGITGLLTSLRLAEEGMKVTTIDGGPFSDNTSMNSSVRLTAAHGTTLASIARARGPEAAVRYGVANMTGLRNFRELIDRYGIACDLRDDTHFVYTERTDQVADLLETERLCALAGIPVARGTKLPIHVTPLAVLEHASQSYVHPEALLNCLTALCARLGVWFVPRLWATTVESTGASLRVSLSDGSVVVAGHVIETTHAPRLNPRAYSCLVPRRAYALSGELSSGAHRGSTYTSDDPVRSTRTVVRHGSPWLVAEGEHQVTGRGGSTQPFVDRMTAWARKVFGVTEMKFQWAAQNVQSPDYLPLVGQGGKDRRVLVATGFGGWGLSNAAAAAEVLRTAVVGGAPEPWASDWNPRRIGLHKSRRGFAPAGADGSGDLLEVVSGRPLTRRGSSRSNGTTHAPAGGR